MSPIISNATNSIGGRAATPDADLPPPANADAAAQFEGMLFAGALDPLSQSLGVLGDVLTNAVATAVARGAHDDFYRHLQTLAGQAAASDERAQLADGATFAASIVRVKGNDK